MDENFDLLIEDTCFLILLASVCKGVMALGFRIQMVVSNDLEQQQTFKDYFQLSIDFPGASNIQ